MRFEFEYALVAFLDRSSNFNLLTKEIHFNCFGEQNLFI